MKNVVAFALLTFSLLLVVGCGGGSMSQHPSNIARSGVVFVGDSIFGRWNLDADFPNKGYINGGMYGYRTDQLVSLLPDVLSGTKVCYGLAGNTEAPLVCQEHFQAPATIVIMVGWNNFFQGNTGNTALSDIKQMVSLAQAQGVRVVVCTLYAYDPAHPQPWMVPTGNAPVTFYDMWRVPLNKGLRQLPDVTLVDFAGLLDSQSDYTIDGIHPNLSAYGQMRDFITPKL